MGSKISKLFNGNRNRFPEEEPPPYAEKDISFYLTDEELEIVSNLMIIRDGILVHLDPNGYGGVDMKHALEFMKELHSIPTKTTKTNDIKLQIIQDLKNKHNIEYKVKS